MLPVRLPAIIAHSLLIIITMVAALLPAYSSVAADTTTLNPNAFALYDSGRIESSITSTDSEGTLLSVISSRTFTIYDISDPTNLRTLSMTVLPDSGSAVQIEGEFAYVTWGSCETSEGCSGGFDIYDLAIPTQPLRTARITTPNNSVWNQLIVFGTTGYATASSPGQIYTLDLSDPSLPIIQINNAWGGLSFETMTAVKRLDLGGRIFGYVGNSNSLSVLDLSNEQQVSKINFSDSVPHSFVTDITAVTVADGRHMVYLTDLMTGVRVFDLTDPTAPITDAVINISEAITIAASANVAYMVVQDDTSTSKLYTLNLSNPATPTLSSPVPNFQSSYLDYQDDLLITSEGDEALRLSDLTDPLIPNPLGAIPLISNVTGVAANGYLEMLKGYKNLVAADIRHPAAPQIIQTNIPMTSTTSQTAITAAGDYMLLGTVAESWRVLDVSDPSQPQVLSSISLEQNIVPFAAALDETQTPRLAYLISGCGYGTNCSSATELAIYNLSDPANPQKLSTQTLTSNGTLLNLVVRDGYLYLTFYDSTAISASVGGGRLGIYDVRNYGIANLVGSITFEGGPSNLAVTDGLVYVAAGTYGIHAIDVSDPTTPQVLSTALGNLGVAFSGIAADGSIVYASTLYSGELFTLDMRDPTQPILMNQRVMPGGGKSLLLVDDQLIALGDGLTLYRRGGTRAGHVRDLRGAPVPNVKLNLATSSTLGLDASTSSWVATDIGGNFSSDLPLTGTITLTPQFYDTAFWPANRTVTSDSSARDFTLVALPVTTSVVAGQVRTLVITDTQGLSSTLSLPADALANATSITVQEQSVGDTGGLVVAGHAFAVSLAGSGAHFTQPATLKLHYSRGDVRMISDLSALKLYRQTDTGWVAADVNCTGASAAIHDQTTRQIQVAICDSGLYALLGPTERVFIPIIAR